MNGTGSAAMLRGVLDALPDAVVTLDQSGRIGTANRPVLDLFGWAPQELEGRPLEVLVPHTDVRSAPASTAARPGAGLHHVVAVRRDGSEFTAELHVAPIDGAPSLAAVTIRDVTPHLAMLREADRMRDQLLATVTHELRTPLTAVVGYAELMAGLGTDEVGPHARRMLKVVSRNAERELRMVNDLLTVAVGALGTLALDLAATDLGLVVEDVVHDRRADAERRGLRLDVAVCEGSASAIADRRRLTQAVEHLVDNAVKFTPAGGAVEVSVGVCGEHCVIAVRDTGTGIAEADQDHVFERLFRGRNATDDEMQGAGLGLPIVRAVLDAHDGTIELTSTEGEGTSVVVRLPLTRTVTAPGWTSATGDRVAGVRA